MSGFLLLKHFDSLFLHSLTLNSHRVHMTLTLVWCGICQKSALFCYSWTADFYASSTISLYKFQSSFQTVSLDIVWLNVYATWTASFFFRRKHIFYSIWLSKHLHLLHTLNTFTNLSLNDSILGHRLNFVQCYRNLNRIIFI